MAIKKTLKKTEDNIPRYTVWDQNTNRLWDNTYTDLEEIRNELKDNYKLGDYDEDDILYIVELVKIEKPVVSQLTFEIID